VETGAAAEGGGPFGAELLSTTVTEVLGAGSRAGIGRDRDWRTKAPTELPASFRVAFASPEYVPVLWVVAQPVRVTARASKAVFKK
jgi:hypothetical protein